MWICKQIPYLKLQNLGHTSKNFTAPVRSPVTCHKTGNPATIINKCLTGKEVPPIT